MADFTPTGAQSGGALSLDQLIAQVQNIVLVLGRLLQAMEDGTGLVWQPYNSLLTSLAALQASMTTQDLIVGSGAGTVARLADGTEGTKLTLVGGVVSWAAATRVPYVAKTATYPIVSSTDAVIDCTANTFTVTLPTAVGITGQIFIVKNSGAGTITVARTSGQTIDAVAADDTLAAGVVGRYLSTGANWIKV